jgi:hypothetical protein
MVQVDLPEIQEVDTLASIAKHKAQLAGQFVTMALIPPSPRQRRLTRINNKNPHNIVTIASSQRPLVSRLVSLPLCLRFIYLSVRYSFFVPKSGFDSFNNHRAPKEQSNKIRKRRFVLNWNS